MLDTKIIESFNSALLKLTGHKRREFAAELCEHFFEGSPRKMEVHLKVGREMVKLGMNEYRTGIRCLDDYEARGIKKKKQFMKI